MQYNQTHIIQKIINRDELKDINIPQEFGDRFKVIILPVDTDVDAKLLLTEYQANNGFSNEILANENEDVWNDI